MEYTAEILDRSSGDLKTVSLGDFLTVTEYGKTKGLGPRQIRTVLSHLDILQEETEVSAKGASRVTRRRLTDDAVKRGLGKRIYPKKPGSYPFDVLSPQGQTWIDERLPDTLKTMETGETPIVLEAGEVFTRFKERRSSAMTLQMEVCFLMDHFPDLAQVDICKVTGGSPRMVSRYVNIRADQHRYWQALKVKPLGDPKLVTIGETYRPDLIDPVDAPLTED